MKETLKAILCIYFSGMATWCALSGSYHATHGRLSSDWAASGCSLLLFGVVVYCGDDLFDC